jgi:hypothetical protein
VHEKNKVNELSGHQFPDSVLGLYGRPPIAIVLFYNSENLSAGPAFKKLIEEEFMPKIPKSKVLLLQPEPQREQQGQRAGNEEQPDLLRLL